MFDYNLFDFPFHWPWLLFELKEDDSFSPLWVVIQVSLPAAGGQEQERGQIKTCLCNMMALLGLGWDFVKFN